MSFFSRLRYPSYPKPEVPCSSASAIAPVVVRSHMALMFPDDLWPALAFLAIHTIFEPHLFHPLMDHGEALALLKDGKTS